MLLKSLEIGVLTLFGILFEMESEANELSYWMMHRELFDYFLVLKHHSDYFFLSQKRFIVQIVVILASDRS
jgi:hypothetical protein